MKHRKFFQFSPIARKIAIGVVIISILAVAGYLFAANYFAPEKMAHRELEKISRDYYENFFYDNFVARLTGDQKQAEFEKYTENGFPRVYLRELFLYDNEKHADSKQYFKYQGYTCNTDQTYVTFYPTAPFGDRDYRIEYNYSCE